MELRVVSRPPSRQLYEFGKFCLDATERVLLRDSQIVPLTPKVFELLMVLVQNCGHVVEKDELMKQVWPDSFVEEANLSVNMTALRRALGEGANDHQYVETVPRRGYRFVASVKVVQIDDIEPVSKEGNRRSGLIEARERADWQRETQAALATDSEFKRARRRLSLPLAAASVMLIALAVALVYLWISSKPKQIETVGALKSIAVLPFKPLVADSRDQSLEMGMANTLIDKLSASRHLIVRPLIEVRKYTKLDQDPLAAGRELRVDYVLEGYLQTADAKTRATMRLWSVKDGATVWTDHCDQACSNIFELQDVIAERIAGALSLKLTGEEKKQLAKHYTDSPQAYHLYSLGMLSGFRLGGAVREEAEKAIEYFEQAIKVDPKYALAYCRLSGAYYDLGLRGFLLPEEARQKRESAVRKALELDDALAEAHAELGQIMKDKWDWEGAEKEFKRALELDPNSVSALFLYNAFLVDARRPEEALVYAKRGDELAGTNSRRMEAFTYFHARKYDIAIQLWQLEIKRDPKRAHPHFFLGEAYLAKGMYEQGIAEMQEAVALDNAPQRWDRYPMLAYAYAVSGKRDEALKILDEQKRLEKHAYISPYNFAIIYTGLGDKDRAFEYLNKAFDERVDILHHFPSRPTFDSLRSDPRYVELLRKMNLAP